MFLQPCTLSGVSVRLQPMEAEHLDALAKVAFHEELWRWTNVRLVDRKDLERYIADALKAREEGTALPFVTVEVKSGQIVGSTRFLNADASHKRVEIGSTFVSPPWQRTTVNTEAKYLMLKHAFEQLGCIRVELKTDALNTKSRAAIQRIGAIEEGTLRKHMIVPGGRVRDTVYFSITDVEWPTVAERLLEKLNR